MKNLDDSKDELTWTTVATFSFLHEALGLRMRFESEGIESFIPEEFTSSINPFVTAMQVRVQVRPADFEAAKLFYQTDLPVVKNSCPHCESEKVIHASAPTTKNWLKFLTGIFVGVPMGRSSQKWVCQSCGAVF